jgi:SAM-dependent methyltransferase
VDPSVSFVSAVRSRWPEVEVHLGTAEDLRFATDAFDVTVAQLVVHFMVDPVAGLQEMRRVTRPGGVVTASVWDFAGRNGPVDVFWRAVHELDPDAEGERGLRGGRDGQLRGLAGSAGLRHVTHEVVTVTATYTGFTQWWTTFSLGVGPAGTYYAGLDEQRRAALRARCAEKIPSGPFRQRASAWTVSAHP